VTALCFRLEFHAIVHTTKDFQTEWKRYKAAVRTVSQDESATQELLAEIEDDMDESLESFNLRRAAKSL